MKKLRGERMYDSWVIDEAAHADAKHLDPAFVETHP
jgi:hypothetical protein